MIAHAKDALKSAASRFKKTAGQVSDKLHHQPRRLTAFFISAMLMGAAFMQYACVGVAVRADGRLLGILPYQEAQRFFDITYAGALGTTQTVTLAPELTPVIAAKDDVTTAEAVREGLRIVSEKREARYVVTADGEIVGATRTVTELTRLIKKLKTDALGATSLQPVVKVTFPDVKINYREIDSKYFMSQDEMLSVLSKLMLPAKWYTFQHGDTITEIASSFGTTAEALSALNPDVDIHKLKNGDVILVSDERKCLAVTTETLVEETTPAPRGEKYVQDPDVRDGTTVVKHDGKDGVIKTSYSVKYENGKEISRTIISQEEVIKAEDRVYSVGCKDSGFYFDYPIHSKVTSDYGWRTLRGKKNWHTGVDFKAGYGEKIRAAAAGRVIKSGVYGNGNYGNLVVIDHGNGFLSYYAHNSELCVKVGEYVERGELISYAGSTGNSTGPHLHFEIRIDNKNVNPWDYLTKVR